MLGLELGADDYITKPFSVREFRSRVKAVLRRAALRAARRGSVRGADRGRRAPDRLREAAVEVRGEPVRLTYVEFEILAALARAPGRVFSRTMLLERVWGDAAYRDPRTIDVHIRHLREKLEQESKTPELILTVRGVGYRFSGLMSRLRSLRQKIALMFFADHGAGVLRDLVRRGAPARGEPQGAGGSRASRTKPGTRGRRCRRRSRAARRRPAGTSRCASARRRTRPTRR